MTIADAMGWIFGVGGMLAITVLILAAGGLLRDLCISANSIARSLERIAEHAEMFIEGDCDCDTCAARFEPSPGADVSESSDDALDELDDELSGSNGYFEGDEWKHPRG